MQSSIPTISVSGFPEVTARRFMSATIGIPWLDTGVTDERYQFEDERPSNWLSVKPPTILAKWFALSQADYVQ
jgi:hypothetical protein